MKDYKQEFFKLNKKRTTNLCCDGKCPLNWVSENDTLICGKCNKEKHLDHFYESNRFYLCTKCDESTINMIEIDNAN